MVVGEGDEFGPCRVEVTGLLKLKNWCVLQDLVPNVWELIFSQVPIKRRVIYMNAHHLLYVSCDSLQFPVDNSKTFRAYWVSCGATVVVDGGWGPKVFFEPVPKSPARFSYVFLKAVCMWAFEFVDYSILL